MVTRMSKLDKDLSLFQDPFIHSLSRWEEWGACALGGGDRGSILSFIFFIVIERGRFGGQKTKQRFAVFFSFSEKIHASFHFSFFVLDYSKSVFVLK